MLSLHMLCHKNIDAEVIKEKAKPAPEKKGLIYYYLWNW